MLIVVLLNGDVVSVSAKVGVDEGSAASDVVVRSKKRVNSCSPDVVMFAGYLGTQCVVVLSYK
jgi:hypothetical protein